MSAAIPAIKSKHYKHRIRPGFEPTADRRETFLRLMDDDCLTTGLRFCRERRVWRPAEVAAASLDSIAAAFRAETA
ncbi:MAG TPA: hypothetical protein VFA95_15215 [Gammaproteobacteria bacterium]|nr:hypothetical protein [Gammaproteobacteria bacterium]